MYRPLVMFVAFLAVALGAHAIRASLHRGRAAEARPASHARSPFERCMADARKSYGPGTLPVSIKRQFTMECEAKAGR